MTDATPANETEGQRPDLKSPFDVARGTPGQFEELVLQLRDDIAAFLDARAALQNPSSLSSEDQKKYVTARNRSNQGLLDTMGKIALQFSNHPHAATMLNAGLGHLEPEKAAYLAYETVLNATAGSPLENKMALTALSYAERTLAETAKDYENYPITLHRTSQLALDLTNAVPAGSPVEGLAITFILDRIPELFEQREKIIAANGFDDTYPAYFLGDLAKVIDAHKNPDQIQRLAEVVNTVGEIMLKSLKTIQVRKPEPAASTPLGTPAP